MKSFVSVSLCLLLVALAAPAFAASPAADVQHLFGESTPTDEQSRTTQGVSSASAEVNQAATPGYAGRAQWHEADHADAELDAAVAKKPPQTSHEPAGGTSPTMVPEPSAIILALAALVSNA
jgi:hypothetical protein